MEDMTDSQMTIDLMSRFGISRDRAADVADAIVKTHGRIDIYSLTQRECQEAGRLATQFKKMGESS